MTRQAFDALVRKIEDRYAGRHAALERATIRWIVLGLVALLSWLIIITGLAILMLVIGVMAGPPVGVVLIVIGVPLAVYGIFQMVFVLRVELDPLEGHLVAKGEAPELEALLEDLRRELGCEPFDGTRLTFELNAGVREIPRLGMFGWYRTVLNIGLPLARATTPDEFKAILAHEFVHHSGRHGRSSSLWSRLNRTWSNVFETMQRPAGDSLTRASRSAICKFLEWYWPRLHARGLVLSRAREYEADRDAAAIAGPTVLVTALWRTEGLSPWLSDRFWPDLFAHTVDWPEPPRDIVDRLTTALETPPTPEDAALWTERALVRATVHDETHPSFLSRARALGVAEDDLRKLGFLTAAHLSAADLLLGDLALAVARELSAKWYKDVLGMWRERHRRAASEARRRAAALETAKPETDRAADVHALWDTACQTANLQGLAQAAPLLRQVLERNPHHDGAAVALGRHLIVAGDQIAAERLLTEVLARNDEGWVPGACAALLELYRATGRVDELRTIQMRLDRHESEVQASQRERSAVTAGDRLIAHGLTDDELVPLTALLTSDREVEAAWLVRKELRYFPGRPLFILCIRGTGARWWSRNSEPQYVLVRRLVPKVELPGQVLVISSHGTFRALARRIMKARANEVFRRGEPVR